MKVETAVKVIQKEAQFLGMSVLEVLQFIAKNPLAQPKRTLEAFNALKQNNKI